MGGSPSRCGQQVLGVEHPDDLVDGLLEHRHPGVELLAQQRQDLSGRHGHVEAEHVGTRHHHLAHQGVLQLEHLVDHLALGALDHALARAHVHQRAELFLGDLGLPGLPLGAGQAERDRGERAESHPDRLEQDGEPRHRPVHPARESQRVLHRQGHRQHLAEHGEQEHHGPDGDGETLAAEELLGDGGGEGGSPDVHHRDADEERDQQLVGLGEQRRERPGRLALLLGQLLQPRPAQREVRGLRAGEQRGEQDQDPEDDQLQEHQVIHGSARSRRAS